MLVISLSVDLKYVFMEEVVKLKKYAVELRQLVFNRQNRFKVVTFFQRLSRITALILLIIETIEAIKD